LLAYPLTIPDLELLDELGRGAHSIVYRARRDGRIYAVKVPREIEDATKRKNPIERFRREAAALARVRHRALPEVMQVGEVNGTPYLVMELVNGIPLNQRLSLGPITEVQTLELGWQLASALVAIHQCGLVHQDIKPRNILFEPDSARVRLVDFELAAEPVWEAGVSGGLAGRAYVAPEQLTGAEQVDGRTDLYALGCVLYECLAARPPFVEGDAHRHQRQSARPSAPALSEIVPHVQPRVSELVARLLASNPEDRYPTAEALLGDLERLQRGEVPTWLIQKAQTWSAPASAAKLTATRLFGRLRELELLREAWLDAADERARVVILRGPTGVGKTRLIAELFGEIHASSATTLWISCDPADPKPFSAVRQLLEGYVRDYRRESSHSLQEAENHLRALAGDFAPLIRVLSPLLAEVFRDAKPIPSPEEAHKVFLEGLAGFVNRLLLDLGPVALFVDNVQWLDSGSRQVLARATDLLATSRTLIIFATRSDPAGQETTMALTRGLETQQLLHIEIEPLARAEVGELVRSYLGAADLDNDVMRYVDAFADNTPLSILELLRTMLESGALLFHWGRWILDQEAIARLRLPSQVAELVARRIEALSPHAQRTLAAAALLGSSFHDRLLIGITDLGASETLAALAEARRAALIESQAQGSHCFVHDLVRETLLENLSLEAQHSIHQRIAESLDDTLAPQLDESARTSRTSLSTMDQCYLLATHYGQGEMSRSPSRVLETNVAAGQSAFRSFDNERALGFFAVAADAAKLLRTELSPEFEFTIAEAQFRTGALALSRKQFQKVLSRTSDPILLARAHSQVAKICEANFDTENAWSSLDQAFCALGRRPPTGSLSSVLLAIAAWFRWALFPFKRRKVDSATEQTRLEVICALHHQAARLAFQCAEPLRFLVATLTSLGFAKRMGPSPALVLSYQRYAFLLILFGMRSAGLRYLRRADELCESLGDPVLHAYLVQLRSVLLAWAGDIPGAIRAGEELLDEYGHWRELSEYCIMAHNQQLLESVRGRNDSAWQWVRRAVQRLMHYQGDAIVPEYVVLIARATLTAMGRRAESENIVAQLRQVMIPTPPGSGLLSFIHGPRVAAFTESGRLDEEFEAIVQEVRDAGFNPARAHLVLTEYYVRVAHARVHQCLRATTEERPRLLSGLHGAVSELGKAARIPLIKAHHLAVRAYLNWFSGKTRAAERDFAEAERLGREQGAPWVLYAVHRGRAHMHRARGQIESALDEARLAESLARTHRAVYRLRWIREEFELRRADHVGLSDPTSLLAESDSSPAPGGPSPRTPGQLRSVLEVMRTHHASLDPERQARAIIDELVRALHAERGFLYLGLSSGPDANASSGASPELRLVAGRDDRQCDIAQKDLDLPLLQRAIRQGAAFIVEPAPESPRKSGYGGGTRYSSVVAPLMLEGVVVGIARLDRRLGLGEFTDDDAELFNALACQVPLVLELMRWLDARGRIEEHERTAQKMEAVARMAGGIAHDFNNMLSAIRMSAENILAEPELMEHLAQDAITIQSASQRAEELTRQLLAFSRSQHLEPEVVSLDALIERAMPVLRSLVGPNIELVLAIDPDVYPVKVDPSQLHRALTNLVTNARDAISGTGRITISARNVILSKEDAQRLSGLLPGPFALLAVGDSGQGIDPAICDKIFDPFFTTKADKGGSGLGLATTHGIVRQSGGAIEVESRLGQGTTFRIYIPKTLESLKLEAAVESQPKELQGSQILLLVEDEPLVNHATCRLLRSKGYQVIAARDGNEALRMASEQEHIDLLITDVVMPGMNGVELARELRKSRPDLTVLYTSGFSAGVVGESGAWGTHIEFLQKPVGADMLIARVQKLLQNG
jgi:eukaryotic-like serine/threonine-protein kinase